MQEQQKAGGIIINDSGKVLVITNNLGRHTFPKGSVEQGENFLETAQREIREETGLTEFIVHEELGILTRPGYSDTNTSEPSVIKNIHFFYCTTSQEQLRPGEPEVTDAKWASPDELAYLLSWPEEVTFFEEQRAKLGL
jgi:8-oxo-dGTP pyrophosphatase MutT (NUDIX family)